MSERQRTVGINGAGAIGTSLLRRNAMLDRDGKGLAITTVAEEFFTAEQIADHVKHDPIYGELPETVARLNADCIQIGDRVIRIVFGGVKHPVNWAENGVWSVLEATGQRTDTDRAREHITQGWASKVIITAPSKGTAVKSLIVGVNEREYDPGKDDVVDNASCTTKSVVHIIDALDRPPTGGVHSVSLVTVHAETGEERRKLIQNSGQTNNISKHGFQPTTTGAQAALEKLFPRVIINAKAYRVPVPDGSISDMTIRLNCATAVEKVRRLIANCAHTWTLDLVEKPIAHSSDLIGNPHDAVVCLADIETIDEYTFRIRSGYDNGFAPAGAALALQGYMIDRS